MDPLRCLHLRSESRSLAWRTYVTCSACVRTCPQVSGSVEQSGSMLSDDVAAKGYTLLCVATPTTDCKVMTISEVRGGEGVHQRCCCALDSLDSTGAALPGSVRGRRAWWSTDGAGNKGGMGLGISAVRRGQGVCACGRERAPGRGQGLSVESNTSSDAFQLHSESGFLPSATL